jgi:myosin heavy subunit
VKIKDELELITICELLGGPGFTVMKNALEQRMFGASNRSSSVAVPLNLEDAIENRDALSKVFFFYIYFYYFYYLFLFFISYSSDSHSQT